MSMGCHAWELLPLGRGTSHARLHGGEPVIAMEG